MQKDNQARKQDDNPVSAQPELSAVWQELLGVHPQAEQAPPGDPGIPTLEKDPWSSLAHANGIEVVDLQKQHLHISDQEVEQVLELMQEQPAPEDGDEPPSAKISDPNK